MAKPLLILSFILLISCINNQKASSDDIIDPVLIDSSFNNGTLIGWHFMDTSSAITVDSMMKVALKNGSFEGKIKGSIQQSCEKAGCWISLDIENRDEDLFIHFQDYFTIPLEYIKGDFAELTGHAILDTNTIENQIEDLDKMKASGQDVSIHQYENITEDIIDVSFKADAIYLKKI